MEVPAASLASTLQMVETRVGDAEGWLAVAVASTSQRHPHYVAAKRFLDALREGHDKADGILAEFVALRPDILRERAISFSAFPNKHEAAIRFVHAAKAEACRITDYCYDCVRSPVNCVCPRAECTRCGRKIRGRDAHKHDCVDNTGNRWVGGLPRP